jgi:hypothetical protein
MGGRGIPVNTEGLGWAVQCREQGRGMGGAVKSPG